MVCADLDQFFIAAGQCYVVCADLDQFYIAAGQCYVVCTDLNSVMWCVLTWIVLCGVC